MNRRKFIKAGLFASAVYTASSVYGFIPAINKSRVVIGRNDKILNAANSVDIIRLGKILDDSMRQLFEVQEIKDAWKRIVKPGETIGLKVNCLSGRGSTHVELIHILCERLQQAGIKENDIIIWDRWNSDLEEAGFKVNMNGNKIRCYGNDHAEFEYDLEVFGSAGSRITKIITRQCDGIINIPVLKDHSIAGVTISLKNMFGAIHNPNKYHLKTGNPYIADVNALPSLKHKIRLHICDALESQYQGGPSFMPQWRWLFNGILVSQDPVALDYTGWQIIEKTRSEKGLKSLKDERREPLYISTAGDSLHRLGNFNSDLIEVVYI